MTKEAIPQQAALPLDQAMNLPVSKRSNVRIMGLYSLLDVKGYEIKGYFNLPLANAMKAAKDLAVTGKTFIRLHEQVPITKKK